MNGADARPVNRDFLHRFPSTLGSQLCMPMTGVCLGWAITGPACVRVAVWKCLDSQKREVTLGSHWYFSQHLSLMCSCEVTTRIWHCVGWRMWPVFVLGRILALNRDWRTTTYSNGDLLLLILRYSDQMYGSTREFYVSVVATLDA